MPTSLELKLFADYHQIHVVDDRPDAGDLSDWGGSAVSDGMALGVGALGIGMAQNMDADVSVVVLDAAPPDEPLDPTWQHIVEASMEVQSGRVMVMGCSDYGPEAKRVDLAPGAWRLRASSRVVGPEEEKLLIELWAAPSTPVRVLRRRG